MNELTTIPETETKSEPTVEPVETIISSEPEIAPAETEQEDSDDSDYKQMLDEMASLEELILSRPLPAVKEFVKTELKDAVPELMEGYNKFFKELPDDDPVKIRIDKLLVIMGIFEPKEPTVPVEIIKAVEALELERKEEEKKE